MIAPALPAEPRRARLLRLDAAAILKRFFYLERALVIACGAWVPAVHRLESKQVLARGAWQDALIADALRRRVFELHYPDRSLDVGADAALVTLFESARHAPSGAALVAALAEVLVPWQEASYSSYLDASDEVADGPTRRFLEVAVGDKARQRRDLEAAAATESALSGHTESTRQWVDNLRARVDRLGGPGLEPPAQSVSIEEVVPPGRGFALAQQPARDDRYLTCSFYWPDVVDPGFGYGEGPQLQLRSAVSHLNEVWAVETAGAIIAGLADALEWDFTLDAARWLYDESRHMMMGRRRLLWWGLGEGETPLGSYIYEACRGQDAIQRLGMLAFFETKNIGKKRERADELGRLGDRTSQRDMDFDWADEAIHAGYGRRWLRRALEAAGRDPQSWPEVVGRCEQLVAERVAGATDAEKAAIHSAAAALIRRANTLAQRGAAPGS